MYKSRTVAICVFMTLIFLPSISLATFGKSIIQANNQCKAEHRELIEEIHSFMRISLSSKAFEQCIDKRFRFGETGDSALGGNNGRGPYKECKSDPFHGKTMDVQIDKLLDIARSSKDITVLNCSDKDFATAWASQNSASSYGKAKQEYSWCKYLKSNMEHIKKRDAGTLPPQNSWMNRASWPWDNDAGVVFHELTHVHGYDHSSGASAITHCDQENNKPWHFQQNTAPYIAEACARSVLERSNVICGWEECDGGHMILSEYDGSTCICQKDPHSKLIDTIVGLWNITHDGWRGHLEIYPSSTLQFTGRYRSTTDYVWKKVEGTLKAPFSGAKWSDNQINLKIDFNTNKNVNDDQSFLLYFFNGEMAGKTWWNGMPFGVSVFRTFSTTPFHGVRDGKPIKKDHFTGLYQMSFDGGQGALNLNQIATNGTSLTGEYTMSNGETRSAYGFISNYKLDLYIDFANTTNKADDKKFELFSFIQTKDGMAGTVVQSGIESGVRLLKMRDANTTTPKTLIDLSHVGGVKDSEKHYTVVVPKGAQKIEVKIFGDTSTGEFGGNKGNADLYIKHGARPTTQDYNHCPCKTGNDEMVSLINPLPGTYHIVVRGNSTYSGVKLRATVN